jgi:hypothetical protein
MANPTGTTYLTANPSYVWTEGDVYKIVQTDQQEGAAIGASFSGLGVDNQPHQVLLNKVDLVHSNQLTDEAHIAALQAFAAGFTGLMGQNGYVTLEINDLSKGPIQYILQWGYYAPPGGVLGDDGGRAGGVFAPYVVAWPITFPNACMWAMASMVYTNTSTWDVGVGVQSNAAGVLGLTQSNGSFFCNLFNVNGTEPGFTWLAIGY